MMIERNGLSGLALRLSVLALAALVFGCAPRPLFSDRTIASAPVASAPAVSPPAG
ncbi:MAG TPA: hypothetical protein VG942_09525 [Hyphomonadaceae bacterium]|nr:hypothetical protein [Hyphomonadaceae bacterium]